jgi:MFS family permease
LSNSASGASPPDKIFASTLLLLTAVLIVGAGQTVVFAIVPPLSRSIGLTEVESSLMFSASAAASLIANQVWGRASDKLGRLPVVIFGLAAFGFLLALLAVILHFGLAGATAGYVFAMLMACRAFHGLLTTGVLPATQAYLADASDSSERVGGMAKATLAFGLGSVVGPVVVALFAPLGELFALWALSLLAFGVSAGIFAFFVRQPSSRRKPPPSASSLRITPALALCLFIGGGFHIAFLGTLQIVAFIFQDRLHYDMRTAVSGASYTFLTIAAAMILTQVVIVRLKPDNPRSLIIGGCLIGALAYASSLLFENPMLSPVLIGIALALVLPSLSAIASSAAGKNAYGAAMGAMGATQALGFLVGPVFASSLYSIEHSLPLLINSIILTMCAIAAIALPKKLS